MIIDTHAHLQFTDYNDDRAAVIARLRERGMLVINVGVDPMTSAAAIELAEQYPELWAAVALHPADASALTDVAMERIVDLARAPRVVAIGETGLDYYRVSEENRLAVMEQQQDFFQRHLQLARDVDRPLILHGRGSPTDADDAYRDMLRIIAAVPSRGVLHCFGGSPTIAQQAVDLGWYIGVTGIATFGAKAAQLHDVIRTVPLERLLVETDCPYLAPVPYRGRRNEPSYTEYIVGAIASVRGLSAEAVAQATTLNARTLFNLPV